MWQTCGRHVADMIDSFHCMNRTHGEDYAKPLLARSIPDICSLIPPAALSLLARNDDVILTQASVSHAIAEKLVKEHVPERVLYELRDQVHRAQVPVVSRYPLEVIVPNICRFA